MRVAFYYLAGGLTAVLVSVIAHAGPFATALGMMAGALAIGMMARK